MSSEVRHLVRHEAIGHNTEDEENSLIILIQSAKE